eukprot:1421098-Amphidinium_carterae.1
MDCRSFRSQLQFSATVARLSCLVFVAFPLCIWFHAVVLQWGRRGTLCTKAVHGHTLVLIAHNPGCGTSYPSQVVLAHHRAETRMLRKETCGSFPRRSITWCEFV